MSDLTKCCCEKQRGGRSALRRSSKRKSKRRRQRADVAAWQFPTERLSSVVDGFDHRTCSREMYGWREVPACTGVYIAAICCEVEATDCRCTISMAQVDNKNCFDFHAYRMLASCKLNPDTNPYMLPCCYQPVIDSHRRTVALVTYHVS